MFSFSNVECALMWDMLLAFLAPKAWKSKDS